MILPCEPLTSQKSETMCQNLSDGTSRTGNPSQARKMVCALLAFTFPFASAFAQSSSSSPQSSPQTQTPSQTSPATLDPPPQKPDSLAEAGRKAKANKPAPAKGKVYTEDDLSKLKGPGVSVVGDGPVKTQRRTQPMDPDAYGGENNEQYWRGQARQILDSIAYTDQQIEAKKEEIKKFGSGGFDVTTGRRDNIAYINDRNGQLKDLEKRKGDLQKQLDDLADEGRKAGAPASWFR
jgi:hypothetical protein